MKVKIISSLGFKIGLAVLVIEAGALALLGSLYLRRFSAEVDTALLNALATPGRLLSQGALNLNMTSDRAALESLLGRGLMDLMVVSADGRIFHSTNPELAGEDLSAVSEFKREWIAQARQKPVVESIDDGSESYLIHVSPVDVGADRTAFLFVYVKMRTTDAENDKAQLRKFFVIGSLATVAATTFALLLYFRIALTRRLARVAETIDRVAAGDLSARAMGNGGLDEVGQMREGVNHMAARLQQTISSLETTVRELDEARRLLETQNSFREAIISRATEGICVFHSIDEHPGLRFTVWNDAMVRSTGMTLEEANKAGLENLNLQGPTPSDTFQKRIAELWAGRHLSAEEWRLTNKSGAQHIVVISTAPLPATDGHLQILSIVQDITARKNAETDRLRLEREVAHAQKLESLGILAGGIAHDFNNILTAILGHTDLALLDVPEANALREDLVEIQRATLRAADLARQMLSYSGKGNFQIAPVNLNQLVVELSRLMSAAISRKVPIQCELADNIPEFLGDSTQVTQVIMNLVTNAAESMEENPAPVVIRTGTRECDSAFLTTGNLAREATDGTPIHTGPHVFVEVTDTGSGMDPATIEKIFDPFFTTKFTGRGLGLAVVLGIIRSHSGALYVRSRPGCGTTFTVYFPLNRAGQHTAEKQKTPPQLSQPTISPLNKGGLILFTDDEPALRQLGTDLLQQLGYTVLTAADGHEAVQLVTSHASSIRCIILDLTMPRMDGVAAFERIHRIAPHIPVIICSGYSEQNIADHFAGKPIAAFLPKPFNLQKLATLLQTTITPPSIANDI